jgi:hypothetical protein
MNDIYKKLKIKFQESKWINEHFWYSFYFYYILNLFIEILSFKFNLYIIDKYIYSE